MGQPHPAVRTTIEHPLGDGDRSREFRTAGGAGCPASRLKGARRGPAVGVPHPGQVGHGEAICRPERDGRDVYITPGLGREQRRLQLQRGNAQGIALQRSPEDHVHVRRQAARYIIMGQIGCTAGEVKRPRSAGPGHLAGECRAAGRHAAHRGFRGLDRHLCIDGAGRQADVGVGRQRSPQGGAFLAAEGREVPRVKRDGQFPLTTIQVVAAAGLTGDEPGAKVCRLEHEAAITQGPGRPERDGLDGRRCEVCDP